MKEVKAKILECQMWSGIMMLAYSLQIVLLTHTVRCLGQLWSQVLCLNFGMIEQIFTFQILALLIIPVVPLFFDVFFILMNRVSPPYLLDLLTHKLDKMQTDAPYPFTVGDIKLWCLDKSYSIACVTLQIDSNDLPHAP